MTIKCLYKKPNILQSIVNNNKINVQYAKYSNQVNMPKQFVLIAALLLFGNLYANADIKELLVSSNRTQVNSIKSNNKTRIIGEAQDKSNKFNYWFHHSQPKAIDDPFPKKINHLKPLDIDIAEDKPILKGTLVAGIVFNLYEKPSSFKKETATKVFVPKDQPLKNSLNHEIKAESSVESKQYVESPTTVDVVPINFAHSETKYKLFNHDDDHQLTGSAPEVIFQAGDDIGFAHDDTVIDDYEHKLPEQETSTKITSSTTTAQTFTKDKSKKILTNHTKAPSLLKAAASHNIYSAVLAHEKSESSPTHTGHAYFYEKPQIPFTF